MKKFKTYFSEKYFGTGKIHDEIAIEIFRNPSLHEIQELWKLSEPYRECRGYIKSNGDLFIWTAFAMHMDALKSVPIGEKNYVDYIYDVNNGICVHILEKTVYIGESERIEIENNGEIITDYFTKCKQKNPLLTFTLEAVTAVE